MTSFSFEAFFMLSVDIMGVASTDGYFKRVNPAFCNALGYTEAELTTSPYLDFVHPDDAAATGAEAGQLASGVRTMYFENRYRRRDGSWRLFAWTCTAPVPGSEFLYAVARDITEQRIKEKERELMAQTIRSSLSQPELADLIRMCCFCKKVRDDGGAWADVEQYLTGHTGLQVSGGYCPSCIAIHYPELLGPDGQPAST